MASPAQSLFPGGINEFTVVADPGTGAALPVTGSNWFNITTAGSETNTLANPTFLDQKIAVYTTVSSGSRVITTATAINQTGNNTITLAATADFIILQAIYAGSTSTLRWRVLLNDGAALSTV